MLLDPTLMPASSDVLSPRLATLDGATIGVIWNGRPPGDVIFDEIFTILSSKYKIKKVIRHKKPYVGNVAPTEVFDDLVRQCDAVVTGVGD